jgi:hypothetical protein
LLGGWRRKHVEFGDDPGAILPGETLLIRAAALEWALEDLVFDTIRLLNHAIRRSGMDACGAFAATL